MQLFAMQTERETERERGSENERDRGVEFMILSAVKHFQLIKSINYENII